MQSPLVKNLEHFGCGNYLVTCMDPSALCKFYGEMFDRVLVDAPCSGEGMFRKDPHLLGSYLSKGPTYYCVIQRQILESAYIMTRPGGMIMYSTCTFSDIEDEQTVMSFLSDHTDLEVIDISKEYGLFGVYEKYSDIKALNGCVHAFPHRFRGEGHFMALISKKGKCCRKAIRSTDMSAPFSELPGCVRELLETFSDDTVQRFRRSRYLIGKDGIVTMLPAGHDGFLFSQIRYLRTGTCIGKVNRSGRFVPHTALALSLKAEDYPDKVDLSSDGEEVRRYLRGETIDASPGPVRSDKGYVLVCTDGFPLGFAKYDGKRLKNLYERGWLER